MDDIPRRVGASPRRHTALSDSRGSDMSVPIDRAKNGPLGNADGVEPGAHGSHRANLRRGREGDREDAPAGFLIGLVAADGDRDAFDVDEEIGHVETNESRATKCARPPEQEQRPIARTVQRRPQRGEGAAQLGDEERSGLALRCAELAADPAAHGADLGGVAGRVEAGGAMRGGDGREGEVDPGDLARASDRSAFGEGGKGSEVRGERRR